MATITPTSSKLGSGSYLYTWANLANGDVGAPIDAPSLADRTVQIVGNTWGVGGSVSIEGTIDGTNYEVLKDPDDAAITKTTDSMEVVRENPRKIRPSVTAGDGTTDITVSLLCRRAG